MNKTELRELIKQRSEAFDADAKSKVDQIIQDHLMKLIKDAKSVGIYLSLKEEVDTFALLQRLLALKIKVSSGVCTKPNILYFVVIEDLAQLKKGMLNIYEPVGDVIAKNMIDVMIVPMVAYDKNKHRLGHGKGYYDRYLADYQGLKIGLAYKYQEVDNVPSEEHDVKMDIIINEEGIISS